MAAPTPTPRGTPTQPKLRDGYSSKITFALNASINFYEKSPTFGGLDGGPEIPQTTMFNQTLHTFAPQSLFLLTPGGAKVAYNPAVYNDIISIINVPTTITQTWRNGETMAAFGYLKSFKPEALEIGKQPEATVEFVFTNVDSTGTEQAPVFTVTAGSF